MQALDLLLNRQSHYDLTLPAPDKAALITLFQAAARVPDHGKLRPYYFVVVAAAKMPILQNLFLQAIEELELPSYRSDKVGQIFASAPMIIIMLADLAKGKNIPDWEKLITAGCAGYALQLAARDLGFDSFWFSGDWTRGLSLKKSFARHEEDRIVGFLKIGTKKESDINQTDVDLAEFVTYL